MKKYLEQQGTTKVQKMPLVSIIVPVYQVKEYIEECMESLLEQTYTNLEILLVDDGSTDGSGELCDEYARRDHRIRVIHQENQGAATARNIGLDHATGECVAFVDSDDVVIPCFIEKLWGLLKEQHADIAACGYQTCKTEEMEQFQIVSKDNIANRNVCMSSEQMLRQWHGKYKKWETVPWNKLYRRSILDGGGRNEMVRFPVGRKFEDVLTSHLIVKNAKKIVLTTQKLYLYRIRPGSSTTQILITEENKEQNLRAQRERMAFFKERRYWHAYFNLLVGYVLHLGWFRWKRLKRC